MPLDVRAYRLHGSYGFVPDSRAGVSFTVAMALSCQIAV